MLFDGDSNAAGKIAVADVHAFVDRLIIEGYLYLANSGRRSAGAFSPTAARRQ
jgi:hypothetical protein